MEESNDKTRELQTELAKIIDRLTKAKGTHKTAIPSLELIRMNRLSEPVHSVYEPSLCIIAQGAKTVFLADEKYLYDSASYLVASVHLPISGQVTQASPETPYLCLQLKFSSDQIFEIIKDLDLPKKDKSVLGRGMLVNKTGPVLLGPVLRLIHLLDAPEDIRTLAPLIISEILYRVLQDDQNGLIKQFAMMGSHARSIEKAIQQIHTAISEPLKIEELAKNVNMSVSSFHSQFKKVTAMSPLQYQKIIRLQEARRLLLLEDSEAAEVGFQVGYLSPSQFSREYARMFGLPPMRDVKEFKQSLLTIAGE